MAGRSFFMCSAALLAWPTDELVSVRCALCFSTVTPSRRDRVHTSRVVVRGRNERHVMRDALDESNTLHAYKLQIEATRARAFFCC